MNIVLFIAFVICLFWAIIEGEKRKRAEDGWDEAVKREIEGAKKASDAFNEYKAMMENSLKQAEQANIYLFDTYMRCADHNHELIQYFDNPIDYAFDDWDIEIRDHKALKERNFDDIMSLFECTIGEGGKEYYEMDGICLIVENGKCIGYYRPHGEDACVKENAADAATPHPSNATCGRYDTIFPQGKACEGYIAPVAETVEA